MKFTTYGGKEKSPVVLPVQLYTNPNPNPNPNLAAIHTNGRPAQSSSSLCQALTLVAIFIKLIYALLVLSSMVKKWEDWEEGIKAMRRLRESGDWPERNGEPQPEVKMIRGFWVLGLGFAIVYISALITAFVGGIKKNLYLLLVWIVSLCLDIILQLFVLGVSSIIFDMFLNIKSYPDGNSKSYNFVFFLLVQSVVLLIFNPLCLICAVKWCKILNLEKFGSPQAKMLTSQGGQKTIYSS